MRRLATLALLGVLVLALPAPSGAQDPNAAPIVVASKPFGESYLLAEMFAQLLEHHGMRVDRRPGLGATEIAFAALRAGEIDVYPEYTGTGLLAILGESPESDPNVVFARVSREFLRRYDARWLPPLGFSNSYAIAVTRETAQRHGLATLTDLARASPELVAGFTPDFIGRPDGLPGLEREYGVRPRAVRALLPAVKYQALAEGRVDVASLADTLHVTAETIRRDLTMLERAGVLRRVHGGAIPVERIGFEPALATRDSVLIDEKERIAKAALAEVPEEGAIILDAGTTTARLAQALPVDRELTVVVNSPPLATALAPRANLNVIMLGGRLRGRTLATVDDWALQPLSQLHVDVAFMATNGCSVAKGLTTPDPAEAAIKRAMVRAAQRSVLLADHTKFTNTYLSRFAELSEIDVVISDTGLDPALAAELSAAGPEVVRA